MKRIYTNNRYTISHIYAYGVYICDAIEDTDRGWHSGMSDAYIRNNKVYAKSSIPVDKSITVSAPNFKDKRNFLISSSKPCSK